MSADLDRLRAEIDSLDEALLSHLSRRAEIAREIGEIKGGTAIYRPEREAQVLRRLGALNPGPLARETVERIFREVMSACLALEQPLRIAYFGPQGTFTESAARKHFGSAPEFSALQTIDDVFRAVETGRADYGVVPVENSTEGAVGRTLDLLLQMPLHICGEVLLRIHHHLLSKASGLDRLQRIFSHAQSLAQCHEWLNRHLPALPRIPVASNAEAARLASEDGESAAIAGDAAASRYQLDRLAQNIEDDSNNTTRFLVIGRHEVGPSGRDKTSLVCSAQNKAGAVHELLEPLARHGVSMSRIESRPSRTGLWEYVFYVDVEGHASEARVIRALAELRERASFVKVLGSYPSV